MRPIEMPGAALVAVALSMLAWPPDAEAFEAFATPPTAVTVASDVVRTGADHPVGIPTTRSSGAAGGNDDEIVSLNRAVINGEQVWWIDMEDVPNGQRDETDLILYTRRGGGRPLPYLECGSCHDPDASEEGALRTPNTGSRLCRACHAF